ncbi:hypothetical protein T310_8578, partial [Rasamsonia emersonii CBS 393.64]
SVFAAISIYPRCFFSTKTSIYYLDCSSRFNPINEVYPVHYADTCTPSNAINLLTTVLHHNALRLDVLAQRPVLNIVISKRPRPSDRHPLARLRPARRARNPQNRHHHAVPELGHPQRPARLRVQNRNQVRHRRDVLLRAVLGDVLSVDVLVLERDLEDAARGHCRRAAAGTAGVLQLAALDLLDRELAVRMSLVETSFDGDDLATEQHLGRLRPAALVDHLLGHRADRVSRSRPRDAAANPPGQRHGVEHRIVEDMALVRRFRGHTYARTHLGATGSQRAIDNLVVGRPGHENGLAIAGRNRTRNQSALFKGAQRRLPVRRIGTT